MSDIDQPAFHALASPRLARSGFAGEYIWAGYRGNGFELVGERLGHAVIAPKRIERLRVGFDEVKSHVYYFATLWIEGEPRPFDLRAVRGHERHFGETMRRLAAEIEATGGIGRIERGTSPFFAALPPLLMGLLFAAACYTGIVTLAGEPLFGRMIPAIVVGPIFALLIWRWLSLQRPRPVRDLDDLERLLPKPL